MSETLLPQGADFVVGPYHVCKRPYLDAFLSVYSNWFGVAVWTSASPAYAAEATKHLFPCTGSLVLIPFAVSSATKSCGARPP